MKKVLATVLMAGTLGATTGMAAEVDRRFEWQQDRIAQGVASGSLNPGETRKLEKQESVLHHEFHNDRVMNGGYLTGAEKAQVNQQQNRLSNEIYRHKHN
jgi:hypothetical protein